MTQAVTVGIFTLLTTDQTAGSFYDDVGGRIYDTEAPVNADLPLCVITTVTSTMILTFDGTQVKNPDYQIDLYADRSYGKAALAAVNAKMFALLSNVAATVSGHDRGLIECTDESVPTIEEDAIRITSQWTVAATKF